MALARSGAYLGRDRRVSPKERTRWRFTFRRLATESVAALGGADVDDAAATVAAMVDLACETKGLDYFRSLDPIEAARFVVSEAVAALWSRLLEEHGYAGFAPLAVHQLLRWEMDYGWTRVGEGWVSERETTLAHVLAGMLPTPDTWGIVADAYLVALDDASASSSWQSRYRAGALRDWHVQLIERLIHGEYEDRLDLLVAHRAVKGRERTFLQGRLSAQRAGVEG